jgi:bacteriophage N4 adsorption protein B
MVAWLLPAAARELTLFAAAGVFVGGIDDVIVDLIWMWRAVSRRLLRHHYRVPALTAATLVRPTAPGRIAIFVACWQESGVIRHMLQSSLDRLVHHDYRIYVGTYPTDQETRAEVRAVRDARVRIVGGDRPGPTTKAECLNRLWRALRRDEQLSGTKYKAIVLHDAEDVVHCCELQLFDLMIESFDMVQLPVLPLIDRRSRKASWISGHYADEFAESHGRQLAVRAALGVGLPLAGVGCAFSRSAIDKIAGANGGNPFDESSLTEDYEIGLKLSGFGGKAAFVAMAAAPGAPLVATRAYFPATFEAAIRQKTRWITGIALAGWDRLRWRGGILECWMRLRDRRSILAACVLMGAYVSLLLNAFCFELHIHAHWPWWSRPLLTTTFGLLVWRLLMRALAVSRIYGVVEGCRAVPRIFIANIIAICAAHRALTRYVPGGVPRWDKTTHEYPEGAVCD